MRSLRSTPEALAAEGLAHLAAPSAGARRLLPLMPLGKETTPDWSRLPPPLAALAEAAAACGQVVRIAALTLTESGLARPLRSGNRVMRFGELQAYEVIEVHDRVWELDQWQPAPGGRADLGPMPILEAELLSSDGLAEGKPDEEHLLDEAFERSFRWLCLVFWAEADELPIVAASGLRAALPALRGRIEAGGLEVEAEELAACILAQPGPPPTRAERAALVRAFCGLWSLEPLQQLLARPQPPFEGEELPALVEALLILPEAEGGALAAEIVARQGAGALLPTVELLARTWEKQPGAWLSAALAALSSTLTAAPAPVGRAAALARVDGLLALLRVLSAEARDGLLVALAGAPEAAPVETVLLPLAIRCREAGLGLPEGLRLALIQVVEARETAVIPSPQVATLRCACEDCSELRAFLDDPRQHIWSLKSTKARRSHVEGVLRKAGLPLTVVTDTRSNPHVLLCTKSPAGAAQRAQNRHALGLLGAAAP